MTQLARNETTDCWGFLTGARLLIHDRNTKYCAAFRSVIRNAGIRPLALPPQSPNLNAFAERWVRSVKEECLNRLVFFGTPSLHRALREFETHYIEERTHQGLGNELVQPPTRTVGNGAIERRDRLGGLLNHYRRRPA